MIHRGHNRGTRKSTKTYVVRVNCLPHDITEQQVRVYFDGYGTIESVALIKKQSRGFVNYYSLSCAQKAAEGMNDSLIGGKVVKCKASTEPWYRQCKPPEDPPVVAKYSDKVPKTVSKHTVKVSYIAKATTERTLFNLFGRDGGEDPESVKIIRCPESQFNHAFVTFFSQADAQSAAESLDREYVDGTEIRAKLHASKSASVKEAWKSQRAEVHVVPSQTAMPQLPTESCGHSKQRRRHSSSGSKPVSSTPSTESCTVKVTFTGRLAPEDIKDVFSRFGVIQNQVVIQHTQRRVSGWRGEGGMGGWRGEGGTGGWTGEEGTGSGGKRERDTESSYTFVTFSSPKAANNACKLHNSIVKQVKLSVVIHVRQKTSDTSTNAGPTEICCSSLVASILCLNKLKYKSELEKLERERRVQITFKMSPACIRISGRSDRVAAVEEELRDLKEEVKNGIIGRDFNLPLHCVPLFEQEAAMKQLRQIETSHGVEFSVQSGTPCSSSVSIETFSDDVKQCFSRTKSAGSETIPSCSELASYFSQPTTGAGIRGPQWFYKDDDGIFVEYTAEQSTKIEEMFQSKCPRQLIIRGNTYTFDFTALTQRNVVSGRSRAMERQVPGIRRILILRVTGLPNSIDPPIRELRDAVKTATFEKECLLYDDSSNAFKKRLLANVNRYFVTAQLEDRRLTLKGVLGYVERVHLAAEQEKISEREVQIHAAMRGVESEVPAHWQSQTAEVVLNLVKPNTEEWQKEVTNIRKTLKGVTVVRLERIQNKWLWERYMFARRRMLKTNKGFVNEKHLFHGTRSTEPEKVFRSEKGVDFRFSREGLWGTGAYFAVNASYSDAYAYSTPGGINEKQMFICQVLTGDCYDAGTTTDKSLRQPPLKSSQGHEPKTYDSVKGYTNGSYVYVVYDHEKVYPAYLVTYSQDGLTYVPSSFSYRQRQAPPPVPSSCSKSPTKAKKDKCIVS